MHQIAHIGLGAALRHFTYVQRGVSTLIANGAHIADLANTDPYNRSHRHQCLPDIATTLPSVSPPPAGARPPY